MLNSSILPSSTVTSSTVAIETANTINVEISNSNQTQHESHELCLDDLLKDDSYEKLMKGTNVNQLIPHLMDNGYDESTSVMSFNNMTINSNYGMASLNNNNNFNINFPPTLETINEDSIKELLGALR